MQDYNIENIRSSAVLTTSYVAGTVLSYLNVNPALLNQLNLLISFTKGSLTTAQVKVEYSHDGVTYFQDTFEAISGTSSVLSLGEYSMSSDGNYVVQIPIKAAYIKISAKGTGTVLGSLMEISAVVGVV